jgi:hypothetical protein
VACDVSRWRKGQVWNASRALHVSTGLRRSRSIIGRGRDGRGGSGWRESWADQLIAMCGEIVLAGVSVSGGEKMAKGLRELWVSDIRQGGCANFGMLEALFWRGIC